MFRLRPALVYSALFSAMTLVGSVQTAVAATIGFDTAVGANLGCTPEVTCPDIDGNQEFDLWLTATGFVSLDSLTDGFVDPNFTYFAAADAQFGSLSATASGSYDLAFASTRLALAGAVTTDLLTISAPLDAPELDGQAGTLDITFLLDGTLQSTGGAGAVAWVAITAGLDPDAFSGNNQEFASDYLVVPAGEVVVPFNIVFGQPFYLSMFLGAAAGTPMSCFVCNGGDTDVLPATGTGSASADFFNTLVLSGLLPMDANGNAVLDAQFSSASNTRYSVEGVVPEAVPEPGSLLLLGSGLALTFMRRRRG